MIIFEKQLINAMDLFKLFVASTVDFSKSRYWFFVVFVSFWVCGILGIYLSLGVYLDIGYFF